MTEIENFSRMNLTFEQAEGLEPLPSQLKIKEISQELRAALWKIMHEELFKNKTRSDIGGGYAHLTDDWTKILYDKYVHKDYLMADEFDNRFDKISDELKSIFTKGNYSSIFGFLQFVIRHRKCPYYFSEKINDALTGAGAAYRIFEINTIMPISSEAEVILLNRAFCDLKSTEFNGARAHLTKAGEELTSGKYSDSIRESIHSVESVARTLTTKGSFKDALIELEKHSNIHSALKEGFNKIYAYTNDEKGLRHPLLNDPSKVDEADALFMVGACASFVSYMIQKSKLPIT